MIAFLGAFHGRSLGSLSLTASKAKYRQGFSPLLPGVHHAPYGVDGYIEDVLFKHLVTPEEVAAVIVEPIQGEGGYIVPPAGWLARLQELCIQHGILFVADEIQSGIGRTGKLWAVEHEGIEPDVLLSGKGIASGMPLGALIARSDLMKWSAGARLDVRRQPGRVRRRARDARPRRRLVDRERGDGRRAAVHPPAGAAAPPATADRRARAAAS